MAGHHRLVHLRVVLPQAGEPLLFRHHLPDEKETAGVIDILPTVYRSKKNVIARSSIFSAMARMISRSPLEGISKGG
jgi:hypothetical protein